MRELRFRADGMRLARIGDFGGITAGSSGFLRAEFELSEDYEGCEVIADFGSSERGSEAVFVRDGGCMVPSSVTGGRWWSVCLVAVRDGLVVETNRVIVRQGVRARGNA